MNQNKLDIDFSVMLILTDGRPSDVDSYDERMLVEDARQAVKELDQQGVFLLHQPRSQGRRIRRRLFGRQFSVIDHIERLPQRLPQLFMALTK